MMRILLVFSLLVPSVAAADFIRMIPTVTARVNEKDRSVNIKVKVKNVGDEGSREVAVEFPDLNESYQIADLLQPKQEETFRKDFSFDELSIDKKGSYLLVYRVLYKDLNYYPFSAPNIASLILPPAPSRTVITKFKVPSTANGIELADKSELWVELRNLAKEEIVIEKIVDFAPAEISILPVVKDLPITLGARKSMAFALHLENIAATLNSSYGAGIIVSGVVGNKHFSEPGNLTIKIVPSGLNQSLVMKISIGVLILVVVAMFFGMKKQKT